MNQVKLIFQGTLLGTEGFLFYAYFINLDDLFGRINKNNLRD